MVDTVPWDAQDRGGPSARAQVEDALAALDTGWSVFTDVAIGTPPNEVTIAYAVLHPKHGIALLDLPPGGSPEAVARFRELLQAERFPEFFPGALPIVHLTVDSEDAEAIGDRLAGALIAAGPSSVADPEWVEAVATILTEPEAPITPVPSPAPPPEAAPAPRAEPAPAPRPAALTGVEAVRLAAQAAGGHAPESNRVAPQVFERPALISRPPRRRRGWAGAVVLVLALLAGFAAIRFAGPGQDDAEAVASVPQSLVPLGSAKSAHSAGAEPALPADAATAQRPQTAPAPVAAPPAPAAADSPPPRPTPKPASSAAPTPHSAVAAAPPPPPPPAPAAAAPATPPLPTPKPTPPELAQAPAPAPAPAAAKQAASPPPTKSEPAKQLASSPPPAPEPPKPIAEAASEKPAAAPVAPVEQTAVSEAPPKPAPEKPAAPPAKQTAARQTPHPATDGNARHPASTLHRPREQRAPDDQGTRFVAGREPRPLVAPSNGGGGPPLDASQLPPLETANLPPPEPQPQASDVEKPAPRAALDAPRPLTAPRSTPSSREARASATGAPIRLAAPSPAPPPPQRECRPYTADTTLLGQDHPVRGLACRLPDGRWKLVSEVPLH